MHIVPTDICIVHSVRSNASQICLNKAASGSAVKLSSVSSSEVKEGAETKEKAEESCSGLGKQGRLL